jgi:predicted DNA-binding protein with PD1-like motif
MTTIPTITSHLLIHTLRLLPEEDLKSVLERFVQQNSVEAGLIMTCVGSLTRAEIRLANQDHGQTYQG